MPKKRFSAEQIVTMLRQIEVAMGQGKSTQIVCRDAGISEQSFRDELLNGEIFYSLKEAQIVIEQWRKHYNTIRPHSSLGYRPPAPRTFNPFIQPLDQIAPMQ
jgi:transposase InsO family protein